MELFGGSIFGGGGTRLHLSVFSRVVQSVSSHCRLGRGGSGEGGCRERRIGTWSEPVDGRDVGSCWWQARNMWGLANAGSMALGRCEPEKGKCV